METGGMSLRGLIDKWLGPDGSTTARITRMRDAARHRGYVQVEVERAAGVLSLMFFRHADGSWCVFPPSDAGAR